MINRKKVIEEFKKYVSDYDQEDEKVLLKIEHTYRVAGLCDRIAVAMGFSKEDVDLAWLLGMLHDVGRFEQLKDYGTFIDSISIDHAQYGVKLLFEKGHLRRYIDDTIFDELIRIAIGSHNLYRLPDMPDERTEVFSNLLRDADKLDILKVIVDTPLPIIYDCEEQELMNSEITKEVMESFFEHHAVNHKLKKNPIDFVIGHISLVFELVFPASLEIVKKQGYLNTLLHFEVGNEETQEQFKRIREDMEAFLENVKIQK